MTSYISRRHLLSKTSLCVLLTCLLLTGTCFYRQDGSMILLSRKSKSAGLNEQVATPKRNHSDGAEVRCVSREIEKVNHGVTSEDVVSRARRAQSVCAGHPSLRHQFSNRTIASPRHGALYCYVPKVASSFWNRFFYQLVNTDPMKSPFAVPVVNLGYFYKFLLRKTSTPSELQASIRSVPTRFVYVRDPFSRLLSAYVDKLLAPNPIFWANWGMKAIKKSRNNSSHKVPKDDNDKHNSCGHSVTFSEFVSFAVDEGYKWDIHIMPVYLQCDPCFVNFTAIGKMETFQRDAIRIAKELGVSERQIGFDNMAADAAKDALEDSSKDSLSSAWLEKSLNCISREDVLKRILRKLQIRGFVSWRFNLNLNGTEIENMDYKTFVSILTQARQKFPDKAELKLQKKQAYNEAYSAISAVLIADIADTFRIDIDMFGYETMAVTLMQLSAVRNTGVFDYTKPWDLKEIVDDVSS